MRIDIMGIGIDSLDLSETISYIKECVANRKRLRVVTANPEMLYHAETDLKLKEIINSAGLVTADGIGVVWAARHLGTPIRERVTGIDLVEHLLPEADAGGWRVYFLGSKPGVAELAAGKIQQRYSQIKLQVHHGYFESEDEPKLLAEIRRYQPDLLLAGLGSPRQEYWLAQHSDLATVSLGVGGSFDALAGIVPRAPQLIRNLHVEWLYRLIKEPWRWKRQSVLPKFALKIIKQKH